jgi:hypothetical protein
MPEWTKAAVDVAVGAPAGVFDQLIQNQDEKRRREDEAAGTPFSIWKHFGTYYNYGVPALAIVGVAMNFLKGDMARRALTAGFQLAGRKVTYQMTKATQAAPWNRYNPPPSREQPPARTGSTLEF